MRASPPDAPAPAIELPEIELTLSDFRHVAGLLYAWTGIALGENRRQYLARRVAEQARRAGIGNLPGYLRLLGASQEERQHLINACTVNETYFYREDYQLAALCNDLLPELTAQRRPGDLIRIWSVPCSTGEEPYSVAIWLLENWRLVDAYNVEIIGSDIDTNALADAKAGRYGARSLARLPPELVETYFEAESRGRRRIIQDLRESVRFTTVNIVEATSVRSQGRFDVILCRNLLIYFDETSRARTAANLFEALNPGGFLCLGHSESMARIDDRYALTRLADAIVYQKP